MKEQRFLKEFEKEELKDKNILISTHGAAMTAMLNRIRESVGGSHFGENEVPPNCSVTIAVQIEKWSPLVL